MKRIEVKDQAALDAALDEHRDDPDALIVILSDPGVWLGVNDSGRATVEAWGEVTVEAWGEATVNAWGEATVRAWGEATVRASGRATVEAWDKATVRAWGEATVRAWGEATVNAWGEATVNAWGEATVEAWDKATVNAWGEATVRASGEATVRASGEATVKASDKATVKATKYVAVYVHSPQVTVSGGVIIDISTLDSHDTQTWLDYTGATVDDAGQVHLYKAVDDDLRSEYSKELFAYEIGSTVTPENGWRDNHGCGHGIHACPRPRQAKDHFPAATRFLELTAPVESIRPLDWAKAKAPAVTVLREVDLSGKPLPVEDGDAA
jgi:hypothetical protein